MNTRLLTRRSPHFRRALLLSAACGVLAVPAGRAANYYADFNGLTAGFGTPVSGNADSALMWNTNALGAGTGALVAFPSSSSAYYTFGTSPGDASLQGTFNLVLSAGDSFAGITVNSTGLNITMNGTGNEHGATAPWYINTGSTLTMSSTRQAPGGLNFNKTVVTLIGGGTFNFGTAIGGNDSVAGSGFVQNMTNGTVNIYETNLSVGYVSTYVGNYTLTNGTLNFASAQSAGSFSGFQAASNSVFAINGGTVDNTSGSALSLAMGSGTISFGGNFIFTGSSSLDFSAAPVILTGNRTVTVAANVLSSEGVISGSGFGLTKAGGGVLSLGGVSTYTGNTIVTAGTLALTNSASLNGSSQIAISGSTYDISGLTAPALNNAALSFTNATLNFAVPLTATTNIVSTTLNLGGTTNVMNIVSLPLVTSYPLRAHLIKYTTLNGAFNIGLGTIPAASPSYSAYLTNLNGFVDLVLTGGPAPVRQLVWTGTDPSSPTYWDLVNSVNWLDTGNGNIAANFNQLDLVTFNDSATGSTTVNVTTAVTPGAMTVSNNAATYTFTGGGSIAGAIGITKQGPGTMILDTYNTYSGGTTISAGTVQVGNNDGGGTLGTGPVADSGSLVFDMSGSSPLMNALSGSGSLTQEGGDTLQIAGTNTFNGTVLVTSNAVRLNGSTLQLGSSAALAAGTAMTVTPGSRLDLNGFTAAGSVTVAGNGNGGYAAVDNTSGTIPPGDIGLTNLTFTGNTTLGTAGNRWDLRSPGGTTGNPATASLSTGGHAYNLIKTGTGGTAGGFLGLVSATVDPMLANIDVQQGILEFEGNSTGLGNPTNTLTVEAGATFEIYAATNQINKIIVVNDGATLNNNNGANTIIGPVVLTNVDNSGTPNCVFNIGGTSLLLSGPLSGNGILDMATGTHTLTLAGNSATFAGGVTVGTGTLIQSNVMNVPQGVGVNNGKYTLNGMLTGGGITNQTYGIVAGFGTNSGTLDANGLVFPGDTNVVGTLTVGGLVVEGSAQLYYDLGATNTPGAGINDLINVNGDLTLNGGAIYLNPKGLLQTATGSYRLINYTGALTVNSLPYVNNSGSYTFTLDTSVPNQVNLVVSGGPPIWNGGSTSDSNWTDADNWGGTLLSAGNILYFAGNNRVTNTNDTSAGNNYAELDFNVGAGAFTLNGNWLTLNGNIENYSGSFQTINLPMSFAENPVINAGTAGMLLTGGLTNNAAANYTIHLQGTNGTLAESLQTATPGVSQNLALVVDNSGGTNSWALNGNNSSYLTNLTVTAGSLSFGTGTDAPQLAVTNITTVSAMIVGSATNGIGVFNLNSGSLVASCVNEDAIDVGNATNGNGVFNMNGGSLTVSGKYFIIGGLTGSGVYNQTGGTVTAILTDLILGNNINTSTGLVSIAGGTFDGTAAAFNVAFRGAGTVNLSGTGLLKIGTLNMTRNSSDSANANGVLNLNGGTLQMTGEAFGNAATGQTGAINFNGGLMQARTNSTTFITVPAAPSVLTTTVKAGGARIDDGGFAITVTAPLVHDATLGTTPDGGLFKQGAGTLTLAGASTYTGNTTISNGTLAVNGSLGTTAVTVASGGTLAGTGSLGSNVLVKAGGAIAPAGLGVVGTLTVASNVTLQGSATLDINAATPANDLLNVGGTLTYGGTLTVTNLAGTPAAGNSFKLFNAASYAGSFSATNLPALGSGLGWTWNPASGTLSVVATVNLTPTNLVSVVNGNQLTLSWPADHTGWRLLAQTNSVNIGLVNNTNAWFTVGGSTATNSVNIILDPSQGTVFYRMVYP